MNTLPKSNTEVAAVLNKAAQGQKLTLDEKEAIRQMADATAAGAGIFTPEEKAKLDSLTPGGGDVYILTRGNFTALELLNTLKSKITVGSMVLLAVQINQDDLLFANIDFGRIIFAYPGSATFTVDAYNEGTSTYGFRYTFNSSNGHLVSKEKLSIGGAKLYMHHLAFDSFPSYATRIGFNSDGSVTYEDQSSISFIGGAFLDIITQDAAAYSTVSDIGTILSVVSGQFGVNSGLDRPVQAKAYGEGPGYSALEVTFNQGRSLGYVKYANNTTSGVSFTDTVTEL